MYFLVIYVWNEGSDILEILYNKCYVIFFIMIVIKKKIVLGFNL